MNSITDVYMTKEELVDLQKRDRGEFVYFNRAFNKEKGRPLNAAAESKTLRILLKE